jgi:hypothetical protein
LRREPSDFLSKVTDDRHEFDDRRARVAAVFGDDGVGDIREGRFRGFGSDFGLRHERTDILGGFRNRGRAYQNETGTSNQS